MRASRTKVAALQETATTTGLLAAHIIVAQFLLYQRAAD
jgi:hypothetical protein